MLCVFLAGPWARTDAQMIQYRIAGVMLLLGVILWGVTYPLNRAETKSTGFADVERMVDDETAAK